MNWIEPVWNGVTLLLFLGSLVFCVKKGILSTRQLKWAMGLGGAFAVLFFTDSRIHPAPLTLTVLGAMTLAGILAVSGKLPGDGALQKYRTRRGWAGIAAVSLYGSLASFFQRFFLENNERIPLSAAGILYCLVGAVWFTGIVWLGLYLLEMGTKLIQNRKAPPRMSRRCAFWTILGVMAVCQTGILLAHWPGMVSLDTTDHLRQIVTGTYSDAHNLMYTLLMQLILMVVPNIGAVSAVQMLLFAWLLTAILMLAYERGVSVWKLCAGGCLFLLLPSQAVTLVSLLKDIPFTMAMLWGSYLLALLAMEKPWTEKWSYWAAAAVDMLLIAGIRHNGIGAAGAMGCLFVGLTLRRFSLVRFRALAATGIALAGFLLYKGPLFAALQVKPNDQVAYTSQLCAVGGYLNKGLELSEESAQIMERVLPLEDWADYYDRYSGHDTYRWGRPEGSAPYTPEHITMTEALQVYVEVIQKAPDVAIHDRLSGADLLWNVSMPWQGFNLRCIDFVYVAEDTSPYIPVEGLRDHGDGVFYSQSFPARAYRAFIDLIPENSMVDMLLWRAGAYLIMFGILLVFWRHHGMRRLWWVSVPMAANILVMAVGMFHQSFRYVYFVPVLTVFLIYLTVIQGQALSENTVAQ